MKALAFVSCATTGPSPVHDRVRGLAVIRADARTFEVEDAVSMSVGIGETVDGRPHVPLRRALAEVRPLFTDATIAGHHLACDLPFLEVAWRRWGHRPTGVVPAILDTATLAWPLAFEAGVAATSLPAVCEALGIPRPTDDAAGHACASLQVAQRLVPSLVAGAGFSRLGGDERHIAQTLLQRLEEGRRLYGPWKVDDGRENPREALEEVLDALHYCAARPGAEVRRGLQARSGAEAPDVDCPVFWPEAKRGKKPNVRAALAQAERDAPAGRIPLAVIRDDRAEPFAVMRLNDLLELVREWWEMRRR